jgi:hypothetical protein
MSTSSHSHLLSDDQKCSHLHRLRIISPCSSRPCTLHFCVFSPLWFPQIPCSRTQTPRSSTLKIVFHLPHPLQVWRRSSCPSLRANLQLPLPTLKYNARLTLLSSSLDRTPVQYRMLSWGLSKFIHSLLLHLPRSLSHTESSPYRHGKLCNLEQSAVFKSSITSG